MKTKNASLALLCNARQRHKINRVINHIRHCEDDELDLAHLADVACLSRYHFARVFTQHCGETPLEFASRLRLEQAVSNLIFHPEKNITSIGLAAGFSSSQSFSNAFRRRFSTSPRDFRSKNLGYVKDFPKNQFVLSPLMSGISSSSDFHRQQPKVTVKKVPAARLAYVRSRGPYYAPSSAADLALSQLMNWATIRGLWTEETEIFGVCPDNPAVTPPQFCQYDYGIKVDTGVVEDETISIQTLPARSLAVLEVKGPLTVIKEAWRWLIEDWLATSGFAFEGHTFFESFRLTGEDISTQTTKLCIPLLR